jgi:hypothetical protein
MVNFRRASLLASLLCLGILTPRAANAIEIKISAQALERTLAQQLFTGAQGRYYIRGDDKSPCYVYADQPKVTFVQDRITVHVHTHSKLGTSLHGMCVGLGLSPEADVSILPDAQGENIGFRDARVENLSESKELNFFLVPFLSRKLPQKMTVNMADLLRKLLANSATSTGYEMKLDELRIHSMQVSGDTLIVDFDSQLSVR